MTDVGCKAHAFFFFPPLGVTLKERISLENFFPTLPLCGEAGNSPHLDLHPSVELLSPHVPHPVAGCGYSAVLKQHHSLSIRTKDCASTNKTKLMFKALTLKHSKEQAQPQLEVKTHKLPCILHSSHLSAHEFTLRHKNKETKHACVSFYKTETTTTFKILI